MYTPTYAFGHKTYRYLLYIQVYNHCMSMPCINCSFYNEHLNICSLDIEDWDTLKNMGVNLNEKVILDSLYVTDETCIEEECHSCKFSIYNTDLSYYECAPFESARNVSAKSIHFKRKNGEEC